MKKPLKMKILNIHKFTNKKRILSAAIYMNSKEDTKLYKEIIKDILCVAPKYGKKIARMIFNKDLKCGNIFMSLEDDPNENNKIVLDKEKDEFGIPMVKLFYKKSKYSLKTAKLFLEEFGNLCRTEDLGRIAIKDSISNLEGYEQLGTNHHLGGTRMGTDKYKSVANVLKHVLSDFNDSENLKKSTLLLLQGWQRRMRALRCRLDWHMPAACGTSCSSVS